MAITKKAKTPKPAKESKAKKTEKPVEPPSQAINLAEASPSTEKTVPNEDELIKTEKIVKSDDIAAKTEVPKKTGKAGKGAKGGGKATKVEKPKKAAIKTEKASAKGKAATNTDKTNKTQRVHLEEAGPLAEIRAAVKTALEGEEIAPVTTENIGDAPAIPITESLDLLVKEELSEEEQRENDTLVAIIEEYEFMNFEEESEATKRDSIEERYPKDSDESEDDDPFGRTMSYLEQRKVKEVEKDFFEQIGQIPDIDQISIDLSIQNFMHKMEAETIFEPEDNTILDEVEEEDDDEGEGEVETAAYPAEKKIPIEDIFSSEISLEYEFESSDEEEAAAAAAEKKVSEENLFEALIKLEEKQVVVEEIDFELLERLNQQRQLYEDTKAFVKELIDCVVDEAEYVDPKEVLRESLDKSKLFNQLHTILGDFHAERRVNVFILRKTVEYYRRQKSYRAITPESDEIVEEEKRKYHLALDELNTLLGRQTTTAEITLNKVTEIEKEESKEEEIMNTELAQLQTLIQQTFAKRNNDRLNMLVDKRIKEMYDLRKELSAVRSKLIIRLHIMARLKEKMIALENIAPGLYLRDYEDLEHERYVLVKKIEERQDDLDRYRNLFHGHTNILAHLQERETMLYHALSAQKDVLNELKLERQNLRAYIYELKKSRIKVKKQIREISFQCGLIDKPALCRDYDEALEQCLERRKVVKQLRKNIRHIERRIIFYTKCVEYKERQSVVGSVKYSTMSSKIGLYL